VKLATRAPLRGAGGRRRLEAGRGRLLREAESTGIGAIELGGDTVRIETPTALFPHPEMLAGADQLVASSASSANTGNGFPDPPYNRWQDGDPAPPG
jgi:hypothetical protein